MTIITRAAVRMAGGAIEAARRTGGVLYELPGTLYRDSTGVTPVSTVGQLVGLMLDSTATVGAELCPPLAAGNGWNTGTQTTLATGSVSVTNSASAQPFLYKAILTVGKTYDVTYTISSITAGHFYPFVGSSGLGHLITQATPGTYTARLVCAGNGNGGLVCDIGTTGTVTNVSYKEITGTHATQATTANKPTLVRGLYNLLTYSPTISHANWQKINSSVTDNYATAPDGSNTATRLQITAANGSMQQSNINILNSTIYTQAIWVKSNTGSNQTYQFWNGSAVVQGTATSNWQLVVSGNTSFASGAHFDFGAPTIGSDLLVWCSGMFAGTLTAQQILANGGIPVTTSAAGWNQTAGRYALSFDGSNDTLTFTPPPITTQATVVWSGQLSDATNRVLIGQSNTGLNLWVGGGKIWFGQIIGTDVNVAYTLQPNTPYVITGQADSGGTWRIRVNGVEVVSATKSATFAGTTAGLMSQSGNAYWAAGQLGFAYINNKPDELRWVQIFERRAAQKVGVTL